MDETTRAKIALFQLYGTSGLILGQTFASGSAATQFLQDFCFNANKKCKLAKGSGRSNTYKCIDDTCNWEVRVCRRKKEDGSSEMYVSTLNDTHADFCTSIAKATERQIKLLPTFRAAVVGDRGVKRKVAVAMVQARDGVNLDDSRSKMYRAKEGVVESLDGEWVKSFALFPSLLVEIHKKNSGTTVHLGVDQL